MSVVRVAISHTIPSSGDINPEWDHWYEQANCSGLADLMHVQGTKQNDAKRVCIGCPVRTPCLAEGLDGRFSGVWGGMTERERNALLKRRPNVKSWTRLLERAQAEYEASTTDVMAAIPAQKKA